MSTRMTSASSKVNPYAHMEKTTGVPVPEPKKPSSGPYGRLGHDSSYWRKAENSESNVPDRFELFLLQPGEKKVTETPDTRTPNTSVFLFLKEDHTLGNLLRAHLLKDPHVNFAGYRVPHPLFANFELRVQTDGTLTPKEALVACSKTLVADLGQLGREFTKEYELRKMVSGGADASKETAQ